MIDKDIENTEIKLAELNLKKMYGKRGYMQVSRNQLIALLKDNSIIYPKRAYLGTEYTSIQESGELTIGGFAYNDRCHEPYKLTVDENGDVKYQDSINGDYHSFNPNIE